MQRNGGISFLCLQHEDSRVDFWVYVCPLDAGFSSKAAVRRLRDAKESAAPWGTFMPTNDPLLSQLCAQVRQTDLPSTVPTILLEMIVNNIEVLHKQQQRFPTQADLYAES